MRKLFVALKIKKISNDESNMIRYDEFFFHFFLTFIRIIFWIIRPARQANRLFPIRIIASLVEMA